jgi:hypothetical protein
VQPESGPVSLDETFQELRDLAHRRFGTIPPGFVAALIVARTRGADWPVRRAALDALVRRYRSGQRDELTLVDRPAKLFGEYRTAKRGETKSKPAVARPYVTVVTRVVPLEASCDCADFVSSSLGACKHVLAALDDLFTRHPLALLAAPPAAARGRSRDTLSWSPDLALHGPLDRLAGLRWAARSGAAPRGWIAAAPAPDPDAVHAWSRLHPATVDPPAGPTFIPDPRSLARLDRRIALVAQIRAARGLVVRPAARAILARELASAEQAQQARAVSKTAQRHLRTLKRALYPYQREGVARFLDAGRLLLADDMGLGKTTQAIAACHALHRAGAVTRGVLIVPASLKSQWLREWHETTDVPAHAVDGTPAERARRYRSLASGFLVLGYEQLLRDFAHVQRMAPDLVVLDEAQRIKNWATKSAAYVKALTPRYRLVLTGTPMENRLEELASILDWVDETALMPKWRLDAWHTTAAGDGARGTGGARNLDTLRVRLAPCMVRRVRKEVLSQLPSRTDTRVPVTMTAQQREEHDALTPAISALAARARARPLTQPEFLRLMSLLTTQRMISNGLGQLRFDELWPTYKNARPDDALLEGLFAPKLFELRRLLEDLVIRQERKVVIFSQWRRMLRLAEWSVRDLLADRGLRAVFFTGAESQRMRTRSVIDFHDEDAVRVMFLSDAGGVGLNLQRAASACINLELPWNPAVLEQRIGRIYRLGQKRPIDVFNLASDAGIEARIADLVASKQALFTGLFDGSSDSVQFAQASSFMANVEKIVAISPDAEAGEPSAQLEAGEAAERADSVGDGDGDADRDGDESSAPADRADGGAAGTDEIPADAPATSAGLAERREHAALLAAGVQVRRTSEGGVVLEAAPEAAAALLGMFEVMAQLLRSASAPP